jgi:hypothetical protein
MPDATHPQPGRWSRAVPLAVATLISGVFAAACGGSASTSNAAGGGGSSTHGKSTGGGTSSSTGDTPLAFAKCMRANGVPNFPDPSSGHGAIFSTAGINPSSPAFKAARAKCQKLTGSGPPGPGSSTHPSAQTLSKLVRIAQCMRQHRVPQFPDPRTSVPSNPAGIQEITDFDGAILLFPTTMNLQAPAYRRALTACGAPPLGLPH